MLKLLLVNFQICQAFSLGTLSSVARNGSWLGWSGVGCLSVTYSSSLSLLILLVNDEADSMAG